MTHTEACFEWVALKVRQIGMNMKVELINTERVIPYARNPRHNDGAISKVAASIKEFGFRQPIVVDKD